MGDSYVISGLVKKRARLAGELEHLRQQMIQLKGEISTLDSAIQIFQPEYNVKSIKSVRKKSANRFFESGERSRVILEVLRNAPHEGLSVPEIAHAYCKSNDVTLQDSDFKKLIATLNDGVRQSVAKKAVVQVSVRDGTPRYVVNSHKESF